MNERRIRQTARAVPVALATLFLGVLPSKAVAVATVLAGAAVFDNGLGIVNDLPGTLVATTATAHAVGSGPTEGYAFVDLATGVMKSMSVTEEWKPPTVFAGEVVSAVTRFNDRIHFDGPMAGAVTVTFRVHVEGALSRGPHETIGDYATFYLEALVGGIRSGAGGGWNDGAPGFGRCAGLFVTRGGTCLKTNSVDDIIELSVAIDDAHRTIDLSAELLTHAFAGGSVDFAHTASFLPVGLPAGLTYTSDSGVFLRDVAGAVPEPPGLLLLMAGLAAVGGAERRRASRRDR